MIHEFDQTRLLASDEYELDIRICYWVRMGDTDKAKLLQQYPEYSKCTQWQVIVTAYDPEDDDSYSEAIYPCAPDGSTPYDTPLYEGEIQDPERTTRTVSAMLHDTFMGV